MLSWFNVLQLGFAAIVAAVAYERARVLFYEAPTTAQFLKVAQRRLQEGDLEAVRRMAEAAGSAWAGRVLRTGLEGPSWQEAAVEVSSLLSDLRYEASQRLGMLRVSATIASTTGLLGAILALSSGFSADGLVALKAGAMESAALRQSLLTMAIGVGLSGFCFYAFGLFRRAALDAVRDATRVARALEHALEGASFEEDDDPTSDSWRSAAPPG